MIEKLSYKQTLSIISQYQTEGHSPLKVIADDFKTYVLKFPKNMYDIFSKIKSLDNNDEYSMYSFIEVLQEDTSNKIKFQGLADNDFIKTVKKISIDIQEDENNNHRLYYTTTKDFVTFTPAKLLFDTHFSAIDATILKRGENDYVMVLKDNTRQNRNLRISFAKDVHGPWTEPSETFTENFVEGPTTVKLGKDYIIYYDRYQKYDFGAMKTRDFIHFTDVTS